MSRERVEAVRQIYDGFARGDFRAPVPLFDKHVVLVLRRRFPDAGIYVGREAIANYTRDLLTSYADFAIEGEEFVDAGDSVVVQVRQRGTGVTSQALTDLRYYQVWSFRGESIIRIESISERDEALAAVGLGG